MFHTAAYSSAAVGIAATDFDLPAITDQGLTISNGHFILPWPANVIGAYIVGLTPTRAKIQTPKTRALANPYLRPFDRSATVPDRPHFVDLTPGMIALNAWDETQILLSTNSGAPDAESAFLWFDDGKTQPASGTIFTIRATSTITGVALTWTLGSLVFDQVLPAGRYAVVGMEAFAANLLAIRLVFPSQQWRPGVIGTQSVGLFNGDYFRHGNMGEFGRFDSIAQPQVEVFGTGVASNPEVYLDLIKVG
jgi:hypothetical protein